MPQRRTKTAGEEAARAFKREMLAALPNLRAFACSLVGNLDKADDLVQETIMKAWAKQESFEPGSNMKAWLFTILRNEFYSQMRKRDREVQDSEGTYTENLSVNSAQQGSLDLQDLRRALAQLPDGQREALILVGASGLSYEEAAEVCGCAVGTVKSRVSRARITLKEVLGIEEDEDYGPSSDLAGASSPPFAL
ncbi:sigma-70 family RNA polymerase sigma factor [Roseibium salinum]|uniref:RNA polymerase sigma factor n=1 Tax=Roseibium salinum TaxID=1604349 RepID=A0ABT3R494_9HYPH|nr:sigma-70 family RNA polymerase sigma factor [Roseibium sp. DSM 29163]MCX2723961.1 sigma-70 family RNA polymerase sigma factor [Roseibium sp. DSM 29163]